MTFEEALERSRTFYAAGWHGRIHLIVVQGGRGKAGPGTVIATRGELASYRLGMLHREATR